PQSRRPGRRGGRDDRARSPAGQTRGRGAGAAVARAGRTLGRGQAPGAGDDRRPLGCAVDGRDAGPRGRPVAGALCACVQADDGPGAPSIPAVAAARTRAAAARAVRCRPFGRSPAYGVRRPGSLHPLLQAGLPHHPGRPGASVAVLTTLESTATERPSLPSDRVGEVLAGRYRVLRRLGAGGMGTVYLAEHVHLGRLTAVKVLCPPLCANDPDAEQRFRQEALLVAKVRHEQCLLAKPLLGVGIAGTRWRAERSEEHTSELQSPCNLVCRLLL